MTLCLTSACAKKVRVTQTAPPQPLILPNLASNQCDAALWQHVYAGRFANAQERLHVNQPCITITGTIISAAPEPDGDFHLRIAVDPPFAGLLNDKNTSEEHGYLVVEPVCENPVSQADTLKQGVCNGFAQNVFSTDMVRKHVSITGAYVTDMEHGWNEIHPVTSIIVQ